MIFIGIMCFITFLAEGALLDWSAVYLKEARSFHESTAGIGYAVFSIVMCHCAASPATWWCRGSAR